MIKPVNTISYIKHQAMPRFIVIIASALLLSGCLGGTVAQQLARSIATSVADNAIANAMDVNDDSPPIKEQGFIANRPPNDLALAISRTSFKKAIPQSQQVTNETQEKQALSIETSALVRVSVFNTIIGKEKTSFFERARMIGALNLPEQQEWDQWHIATGEVIDTKRPITFIIPPTLGKPLSGSTTIVELANIGDISIARYHDEQVIVHQAMDER